MILSQKAIDKLKNKEARLSIALAIKKSEYWVKDLIDQNKPNGPLTTYAAMEVIRKETEMTDQDILVDENAEVESH